MLSIFSYINIRYNMNYSNEELKKALEDDPAFLDQVRSSDKYNDLKTIKEISKHMRYDLTFSSVFEYHSNDFETEVLFECTNDQQQDIISFV